MPVSCECCVVRHRSLRGADHSSRGLPSVACPSATVKPRQWGGPGPLRLSNNWDKKTYKAARFPNTAI